MNLTEQQVEIIKNWAASWLYLQAVRLFGSYAKGSAHPDSDVDLAVTAMAGHYYALVAQWEARLTEKLGLVVNVRDYARNKDIRDACDECSLLLFAV
jgi:predicted nucleotidyltransferase